MSLLNELKKIRRSTPNNQEFGAKVGEYLDRHRDCCDDVNNHKNFSHAGTHPYGWDVTGIECSKCGKIIEIDNIDK